MTVYYQILIESVNEEDKSKGYMKVFDDDNSDSSITSLVKAIFWKITQMKRELTLEKT